MAGRVINPKEEFNKNRKILLLNIPPSTEGEIREFLNAFRAKRIIINDSLDSAVVTLINGNQLEEAVEKLNNKQFKDNIVTVRPSFSNQLVCIAHLPLTYTDNSFKEFCRRYAPVEYSYIMRAAGNGLSKGYGVVEFYADPEHVKHIKSEIDWQSLDGQTLHADFISESFQTWEGLQSRCLLINNMPEDFVDVSKLRESFGCVISPVYCQITTKGDKSLGFAIIEFRRPEDAEQTWVKLKNEKINGKDVVMTFCIPGKSAVVINNRIMWKYGDKQQKSSSLLPDPVSAKPVIAGNPIVISLTRHNPKLMEDFALILGELQQAYVSQMMSPENKPGLLGPAPSLPLSPMMNPNMQLGLLVMVALHIQAAKKEQFAGVLAKQLNTLSEQDGNEVNNKLGPKPSILGDALTGQANMILTSLKQQLNQVPLTGENGQVLEEPKLPKEKIKFIVRKFVANGRYLNLGLLSNLGQLLVNMKNSDTTSHDTGGKGQSLLGPMPSSNSQILMSGVLGKGTSLLGDPPRTVAQSLQNATIASASINSSIMQAMGLNVGSGSSIGSMGQTLLSQISQGLVHQIGQNLLYQMTNQKGQASPGKGLLGDVPADSSQKSKSSSAENKSLLGEHPQKSGQVSSTNSATTSLDQGTWKSMDTRNRMEMTYESKNQINRWGSGAYDNSYSNKGGMGTGYSNYGYGSEAYGDMSGGMGGGHGNYGGYGQGGSNCYYNYQSQYGYGGQTDNVYQTEGGYNSQYGAGYGMGMGSGGGLSNTVGYGMSSGFEGNQSASVNYQDGQVYGKGANSGLGQDSEKYGGNVYSGGMSGPGYGYGGRNDMQGGYESYNFGGGYSTGMGDGMGVSGVGGGEMGSGGMGAGLVDSAGMSSGQMGGGVMMSGQMGSAGMGSSVMAIGGMGSTLMGIGGMSSGQMGSGGMSSGQMGSGGMGSGQMGSGGMSSGQMGSGGMGSGQMGSGGMSSGQMGSGGMGSGQMGSGGMSSGQMGSGGMFSSQMGSGQMGSGGMSSGQMGSGGMFSGQMGSGGMGSGQMGSGGMFSGQMGSGGMGSGQMGSGSMFSGQMGSGGLRSGQMGSGGLGSGQMGSWGMFSGQMGSGGMGSGQMGSGGMGSGQMGSGSMGSGQMGSGGMVVGGMGNVGMSAGVIDSGGMGGGLMGSMGMSGGLMGSGVMGSGLMGSGGNGSGPMGNAGMGRGIMGSGSMDSGLLESGGGGGMSGGGLGNSGGGVSSGSMRDGVIGSGGGGTSGGLSGFGGGGLSDGLLGRSGNMRSGGNMGGGLSGSGGMSNIGIGSSLNNGTVSSIADVYNTAAGTGSTSRSSRGSTGVGLLGSGGANSFGGDSMGGPVAGMSSRESTAYFTGGEGSSSNKGLLLSSYATTAGQKRGYSQMVPQSDIGTESSGYMDQQHSQGLGGQYVDAYKKNRLY